MPNLKFLASAVPEIRRESQNSKSRSPDPFPTSSWSAARDPVTVQWTRRLPTRLLALFTIPHNVTVDGTRKSRSVSHYRDKVVIKFLTQLHRRGRISLSILACRPIQSSIVFIKRHFNQYFFINNHTLHSSLLPCVSKHTRPFQ